MSSDNIYKYKYLGDRGTDLELKGNVCVAVLNKRGKCIRGKNGNMLVQFNNGSLIVVVARLLRKVKN